MFKQEKGSRKQSKKDPFKEKGKKFYGKFPLDTKAGRHQKRLPRYRSM